ncbi:MAG: helix-turn-helix domain-containing protein [Oscillospiraceae bacterium]|nr:helix-turn-helix domain-containing protein [Oscillospiraceae bacterium]
MLTSDIEEKLNTPGMFDKDIIENNPPPELPDVLSRYIDEKKMTKADVIRILNVARNYGYQILNGTRPVTRNILLQISLILKLDIDQINYLLRLAEKPQLYVRNIVDARVFYAVKHNMEYYDALDFIWGKSVI